MRDAAKRPRFNSWSQGSGFGDRPLAPDSSLLASLGLTCPLFKVSQICAKNSKWEVLLSWNDENAYFDETFHSKPDIPCF